MILRECSRLLILFLVLPLAVVEAQAPCDIPDDYVTVPPNDTYAFPGDQFVIKVEHEDSAYFPSALTNLTDSTDACSDETPSTCVLDVNQGLLNIIDFQPHFAGSYRFRIPYGFLENEVCDVYFTLHEAFPPSISYESAHPSGNVMLSTDQGLMLMPSIDYGMAPGVVRWYKDGIFLLEGDTYQVNRDPVPDDRGLYTATIIQSTVNANKSKSITYNVFVSFAQATLTESVSNGQVTLRCDAVGYPEIDSITMARVVNGVSTTIPSDQTINGNIEDDNTYTGFATLTISEASCMNQQYTCTVKNGASTVLKNINICETAPSVSGLEVDEDATTNVSIALRWNIVPEGTLVDSYKFYLMEVGNEASSRIFTVPSGNISMNTYRIPGLMPGTSYSIRMNARNSNGDGESSDTITARPYTVPIGRPRSINIMSYNPSGPSFMEWDKVEELPYAPVASYDVIYRTNSSSPVVISGVPALEQPRYNLSMLEFTLNIVYYFKVRAVNRWGFGSVSAEVEFRFQITDPRERVTITLGSPTVTNTMVTLHWTLSDPNEVDYIVINVERIILGSIRDDISFVPVFQYTVTNSNAQSQCLSNLNRSDVYHFCVTAVLFTGENVTSCIQVVTGENSPDGSSNGCTPVEPFSGSESVVDSWIIAVGVVACVVLVVIVFGGCGLYFGLKRSKKGDANFDSPNQSFDKIPQPHNGYPSYPPPPPHKPVSQRGGPCVICKSNRHNNHAHQMDWRATNPVETTVV